MAGLNHWYGARCVRLDHIEMPSLPIFSFHYIERLLHHTHYLF